MADDNLDECAKGIYRELQAKTVLDCQFGDFIKVLKDSMNLTNLDAFTAALMTCDNMSDEQCIQVFRVREFTVNASFVLGQLIAVIQRGVNMHQPRSFSQTPPASNNKKKLSANKKAKNNTQQREANKQYMRNYVNTAKKTRVISIKCLVVHRLDIFLPFLTKVFQNQIPFVAKQVLIEAEKVKKNSTVAWMAMCLLCKGKPVCFHSGWSTGANKFNKSPIIEHFQQYHVDSDTGMTNCL